MTIEEYKKITAEANGRKSIADSLLAVERTQGWKILKMVLEDKARWLQEQINDIENVDEKDLLSKRIQLYYLKELLDMPHIIADGLLKEKQDSYGEQVYE